MKLSEEQLAEVDGRIAVAREALSKHKRNMDKDLFELLGYVLELILALKQQIISERIDRHTLTPRDAAKLSEEEQKEYDGLNVSLMSGSLNGVSKSPDEQVMEVLKLGIKFGMRRTLDASGGEYNKAN